MLRYASPTRAYACTCRIPQHARIHARATGQADRNVSNNFTQHHFWVNEHHLGQFIEAFPLMAPIITNPTCLQTVGQLQQELQRMKANRSVDLHSTFKVRF